MEIYPTERKAVGNFLTNDTINTHDDNKDWWKIFNISNTDDTWRRSNTTINDHKVRPIFDFGSDSSVSGWGPDYAGDIPVSAEKL